MESLLTEPTKHTSGAKPDKRAAKIEANLAKLPRISLGALFMPAVWGPVHGYWITIIFYPIWVFADICFTNAVLYGGLAIVLAVPVFLGTAAIMIWFAMTAGKRAYLRVADRVPIERYLKRQRIWTFVSLAIAIIFLVLATWYNLVYRIPAGG